jgi:poly(A) polymerase
LESPLDGREIMELLNLESGPKIQEVKDFLCEEVIEGRLVPKDKDTARKLALEKFGEESSPDT